MGRDTTSLPPTRGLTTGHNNCGQHLTYFLPTQGCPLLLCIRGVESSCFRATELWKDHCFCRVTMLGWLQCKVTDDPFQSWSIDEQEVYTWSFGSGAVIPSMVRRQLMLLTAHRSLWMAWSGCSSGRCSEVNCANDYRRSLRARMQHHDTLAAFSR